VLCLLVVCCCCACLCVPFGSESSSDSDACVCLTSVCAGCVEYVDDMKRCLGEQYKPTCVPQ